MRRFLLVGFFVVGGLIAFLLLSGSKEIDISQYMDTTSNLSPTPTMADFKASFEIYTLGTRRAFTQAMYHNQSENAYIQPADPSVIHVKSPDLTWSDFFETLPMELTKECLTTGTGQVFCTNEKNTLRFYINDQELPSALDVKIRPDDKLSVIYE